ncbi:MAG: NAD(P)/FAD-dependent oxidoreductase, partial [Anaerovibrio sp.]|nr:NAD(P)/FAD-dependent oxidoreductase [Anaerovibrio sp.]
MIYDVAIVGNGPAGLSAATVLKARGKNIICFGPKEMSSKVEKAEKISNYPGLGIITGHELNEHFRDHIKELDIEITNKFVSKISNFGGKFTLLADNEMYEAKTVLLAAGIAVAKGFDGENIEENVYLHLTKAEFLKLDLKYSDYGGLINYLRKLLTDLKDGDPFMKPLVTMLETLILAA